MGLTDFFLNKIAQKLNQAVYQYWVSSGVANVMPNNFDAYLEQGYLTNADVYSIITRIDNMRKQAPLVLRRDLGYGESEQVFDHELLRFTKKVNPQTTIDEFITQYLIFRLVLGNFFCYHPKLSTGANKGKPTELHAMPVNEVEILMGDWMHPVKGYRIEGSQNPIFEVDEVYHSKLFNPNWHREESLYGMSPLRAAAKIVSKQNENETTQLKQFQNQGAPYIMYRDTTGNPMDRMTDVQREGLIKEVKKSSSASRRGLPLVLKEKYGVINLGQTLADLRVIESSKDGRRVLCNVYGFPVDLMNDPDGSTYNNKTTARKSAWTDCIQPNLKTFSDLMNECTILGVEQYEKDGLYWDFDYSTVEELQDEMKTRVEWMKAARWTANEIRVATGKEPIVDPKMDEPVFNMGEMFLSDLSGGVDEIDNSDYEEEPEADS